VRDATRDALIVVMRPRLTAAHPAGRIRASMQLRIIPKKSGSQADVLRARGKRLTRPRRLILDLVRSTDAHPSAALVYREVRRHLPRVSLATVYRNLRMLAAEGLLSERADAGGTRFDGNTDPHDHFTCVACGRIYDVPSAARRVAPRVAFRPGFEVHGQRIEFYGRCDTCRRGFTRDRRRNYARAKPQGY
jgi:Fur family transcriptional regulator, peroxide stress response regulator